MSSGMGGGSAARNHFMDDFIHLFMIWRLRVLFKDILM